MLRLPLTDVPKPVFEAFGVAVPSTIAGGHVGRDITDPLGDMGGLFTILFSILGTIVGNLLGDVVALLVPLIEAIDPFLFPVNSTTVSSMFNAAA